jgi:hypothetical protein
MQKAKQLRNQRIVLDKGRFIVEIKAYEVPFSSRFPRGIKLKCVLIDVEQGRPRVLLDNHEPFGFHLHARLPDDPEFRVSLDIEDYEEAVRVFFGEVRKVVYREE